VTAFLQQPPARLPRPWRGFRVLLAAFARGAFEREPASFSRAGHNALRERDPDAWRDVFEQAHAAIYRYAAGRLGPGAEAEDATSQVFAEAWEHAASFDDHGLPVRAWLFGIARNVVNGHRRRLVQRPPALSLEDHDKPGHDPGLDAGRLDLARAISRLEGSWAEVVTLRFVHGLSLQETANAMGLTLDAVKGKQARALAQLRKYLVQAG
jgi:RNA polymerase sigma-70 factor (ECF subfamily)